MNVSNEASLFTGESDRHRAPGDVVALYHLLDTRLQDGRTALAHLISSTHACLNLNSSGASSHRPRLSGHSVSGLWPSSDLLSPRA